MYERLNRGGALSPSYLDAEESISAALLSLLVSCSVKDHQSIKRAPLILLLNQNIQRSDFHFDRSVKYQIGLMVEFVELTDARQPACKANMKVANEKKQSIQKARQTTLLTPMLAEAFKRAKLRVKQGEVEGTLTFTVKPDSLQELGELEAPVRKTLFRRIEGLDSSRVDDDSAYCRAVETGHQATIVLPLPVGYNEGGWRCHAIIGNQECLHPNLKYRNDCEVCATAKPNLKPEFQHLRLLSPSIRSESNEYLRRIRESDAELTKCERYENTAAEKLAAAAEKRVGIEDSSAIGIDEEEGDEEDLMMNVELVQSGVWSSIHASAVCLKPRKAKSLQLLNSARAELAIMMQCAYELAAPHAQKVIRGFILRASLGRIREEAIEFAKFSAAVALFLVQVGQVN
jgi:hypothetical protein